MGHHFDRHNSPSDPVVLLWVSDQDVLETKEGKRWQEGTEGSCGSEECSVVRKLYERKGGGLVGEGGCCGGWLDG